MPYLTPTEHQNTILKLNKQDETIAELLKALQDLEGMCNMPEVKQAMMRHEQAYYHKTMNAARVAIRKAEQS